MAWCRHATSHYLSHCWPISRSPYDVTGSAYVNVRMTSLHSKCREISQNFDRRYGWHQRIHKCSIVGTTKHSVFYSNCFEYHCYKNAHFFKWLEKIMRYGRRDEKLPLTHLFVQQLVRVNNGEAINALHCWPFVRECYQWIPFRKGHW